MDDMKELTTREWEYMLKNALLEQEQRINESTQTMLKDFAENYATKEQLGSVDQKHERKEAVQDKAIKSLEDWNAWAVRIVLGAILVALVGGAFALKG